MEKKKKQKVRNGNDASINFRVNRIFLLFFLLVIIRFTMEPRGVVKSWCLTKLYFRWGSNRPRELHNEGGTLWGFHTRGPYGLGAWREKKHGKKKSRISFERMLRKRRFVKVSYTLKQHRLEPFNEESASQVTFVLRENKFPKIHSVKLKIYLKQSLLTFHIFLHKS